MQWVLSGLKSGGVLYPGKKSIFPGTFSKNFDFSGNFTKYLYFPFKNWSFTATSGQIIPFLFKSHHFQTCFLYITSYNISRPVHDPSVTPTVPRPRLPKIWGSRPS